VRSYRDLPQNLYQIQTKFRDEIRPRFGLMRGREFIMKDAYSFDVDDVAAGESYQRMFEAYKRIFTRCGLEFRSVEADSGTIGGSYSHEFMVLADTGEDTLVICSACEYAANSEKAEVAAPATDDSPMLDLHKVETPGKRKVPVVCEFMGIEPHELVKTLVFDVDGEPVAVLVRGDRAVQEVKLKNLLGAADVEMLDDKAVFDATGVPTGYLGPVGIKIKLLVDREVAAMRNFVTGANEKNYHVKNVNMGRDFEAAAVADLRQITESDPCPSCGANLGLKEGIEVGHVFKLGTGYSTAMKAVFQDSKGKDKPMVMGCYGIGVSRIVAAAIEQNHDENGMIFPMALAPMQVVLLNLGLKDTQITETAEFLYSELQGEGVEVLLDDRDERPGSKFKDADLLGIPLRITVGKSLTKNGVVEIRHRKEGTTEELVPEQVTARIVELIDAAMSNG
ncbi:proline--tRNA ligase, partial [Desulfotalea psychrophila]|nr:proline--tRNA ligase [Desulfotalea psychrophila]